MEKKINIAELLKYCPKGMELDCTAYDNVSFDKISDDKKAIYPIFCYITDEKGNRSSISFTENGCESKRYGAKCVIFPKGKTTWEGFVPPCKFKNGDIIVHTQNDRFVMSVYHKRIADALIKTHCVLWDRDEGLSVNVEICCYNDSVRFATEEEKQRLFQAIKDNGYKWNAKTKTLEKLIQPKFKVGDTITNGKISIKIGYIDNEYYYELSRNIGNRLFIKNQDEWELISDKFPNKFNIKTLVPFESRVLVREGKTDVWQPAFYGFFNQHNKRFYTTSTTWLMCIPYNEDTKHLIGTTNDCEDFYKTWEK